jgi:hypothetical protein
MKLTFHIRDNGNGQPKIIVCEQTGETFEHPFTLDKKPYFADAQAITDGWAGDATQKDARLIKLKIDNGKITNARWEKPNEIHPDKRPDRGLAIAVEDVTPAESVSVSATPAFPHRIDFDAAAYYVDTASLAAKLTRLPDGRMLYLYPSASGILYPAGLAMPEDVKPDTPIGLAIRPGGQPWQNPAALATTRPADLAESVSRSAIIPLGPDAIGSLARADVPVSGAIVNPPLYFIALGTDIQDDSGTRRENHPFACIPLARFRVPEGFGSPRKDGKPRFAYMVLLTTEATCSTRDVKRVKVAPGYIVWLDEKYDIRPLKKQLPKLDEHNAPIKANEISILPKGKRNFQLPDPTDPTKQITAQAHRIEMRYSRGFTDAKDLRIIAGFAANCPDIPSDDVEAGYEGDNNF